MIVPFSIDRTCLSAIVFASTVALAGGASAQEINAPLKELAAAANREGTLTLSWSGTSLGGIQGAAPVTA